MAQQVIIPSETNNVVLLLTAALELGIMVMKNSPSPRGTKWIHIQTRSHEDFVGEEILYLFKKSVREAHGPAKSLCD